MPNAIAFQVAGPPIAQPRHKIAVRQTHAGRAVVHKYLPKPARASEHPVLAYRQAVQLAARVACAGRCLDGPVELRVDFVMPRPQRRKGRWCATKPDLDNLLKAVKDALRGVAYVDDAQVVRAEIEKRYCLPEEGPHTVVVVTIPEEWNA